METTIKPALTAVEWNQERLTVQAERYGEPDMPSRDCGAAEIHAGPGYLKITSHEYDTIAVIDTREQRHAIAALALYGQPFGFTAEDVALLARLNDSHDMDAGESRGWLDVSLSRAEADRLRSLADRIAALLPK